MLNYQIVSDIATGETAVANFDYYIQSQVPFQATLLLCFGLLIGLCVVFLFRR